MCQNLSFPTVVGSEIQALFFTPVLDALSAGPAFEDPLFPDGRLLGVLNVVDCHFDPSSCMVSTNSRILVLPLKHGRDRD